MSERVCDKISICFNLSLSFMLYVWLRILAWLLAMYGTENLRNKQEENYCYNNGNEPTTVPRTLNKKFGKDFPEA